MNFIANKLDKLEKDTDVIKEHQIKMSDNLQQNISAEHINVETFKVFKDEIMLGNKLNQDEINKIYDSINELDGYFHKFGDALDVVGRLVVGKLSVESIESTTVRKCIYSSKHFSLSLNQII